MPRVIEQITDVHVRYHNHRALERLKMHRQRLVAELKGRPNGANFDHGKLLGQLELELAVIQRGIDALISRIAQERGLAA